MTISSALQWSYELLAVHSCARLDAELLLSDLLGTSRSLLTAHGDKELAPDIFLAFKHLCERRLRGEPIAYLLGRKEFWSLELEVNEHTLIPRPETETLVQLALEQLAENKELTVIELGVGSGAVAIALAMERPCWQIYGTDKSLPTLEVAARNANRYHLSNLNFLYSDWYSNLPGIKFDAIISNPPYIANNDSHLKDLKYEPFAALVSAEEGLGDLRMIIAGAGPYLKDNGFLLLEHGYDQAEIVQDLMHSAGFSAVQSHRDFSGILRVTGGRWQP